MADLHNPTPSAPSTIAEVVNPTILKSPLKWAGGKSWLVPRLQQMYAPHRHRRLVEPFCGGMSITLGLQPDRGLCNDKLLPLMNFYQQIKDGLTIDAQPTDKITYYAYRDAFNRMFGSPHFNATLWAKQFYYLNRVGFNGLCRFNASGEFNVPHGGDNRRCDARTFEEYRALFSRLQFTWGTFSLVRLEPTDFVYMDPPYDTPFTSYAAGGFTWDDQVCCAEWLAGHPGPVVASNQATDRIIELYTRHNFAISFVSAPRKISCNGDRRDAREILATRNLE